LCGFLDKENSFETLTLNLKSTVDRYDADSTSLFLIAPCQKETTNNKQQRTLNTAQLRILG